MRHTMTVTALTAALLVSSAAYANNMQTSTNASIDTLPENGPVSLSGTVDRVVDNDTFILRDGAGETIDVHTVSNVSVNEGEQISVKGEITSELAGVGEEINNATVTQGLNKTAAVDGDMTTTYGNRASLDENTQARVAMKNDDNMESPAKASDNTEAKKTAAYDLDAQGDVNLDEGRANVDMDVNRVAAAGEATPGEATRLTTDNEARVNTAANVDRENNRTMAAADADRNMANDTIENLPKDGQVELNGVVAAVEDDNTFTLRDSQGKTIEVDTASNVNVQPGDTVSVNGRLASKLLGLGREINSAQVLVVSTAE